MNDEFNIPAPPKYATEAEKTAWRLLLLAIRGGAPWGTPVGGVGAAKWCTDFMQEMSTRIRDH